MATNTGLPIGRGRLEVPRVAPEDRSIPVWFHRPPGWTADRPVVIVLHGESRDADKCRDNWMALADRYGFLILAPEFSHDQFRSWEGYSQGYMIDERGHIFEREQWTFSVIEPMFQAVRAMAGIERGGYAIFGHSAGAQFAHRALLFGALPRAELVIAANGGRHFRLDPSINFSSGLRRAPIDDAGERRAYQQRAIILLGDGDSGPAESQRPINQQRRFRLEEGRLFFESARARAAAMSVALAWKLVIVPDVGHEAVGMAKAAAALIAAEVA